MRQMLILHVENWPIMLLQVSLLLWFTIVQCAPSPLCQQTGALCGTWGEFITLGTLYNDMGIDWMEINDWLAGDQRSSSSRPGTNLCSDSALILILISAGAGGPRAGGTPDWFLTTELVLAHQNILTFWGNQCNNDGPKFQYIANSCLSVIT